MDAGVINAALASAISDSTHVYSVESGGNAKSNDRKLDIHNFHSLSLQSVSGIPCAARSSKERRGCVGAIVGARPSLPYVVDSNFLAPNLDYDFTDLTDDWRPYFRGGVPYYRPCGWYRFALNVLGRYDGGNDEWIGNDDWINMWKQYGFLEMPDCAPHCPEWHVCYHGTNYDVLNNIADKGYLLSKSNRWVFGYGIYCSPDPNVAEVFASTCTYNGKYYKFILQNRVRPGCYEVITEDRNGVGEYWRVFREKDVRPYGICVKEF